MGKILALVINDYYVGGILKYIQERATDYPIKSPPHITIRGPYIDGHINTKTLNDINTFLGRMNHITLSTVDYFNIDDDFFIYIAVQNDELRKITRKRDYPIYRFGFNPHVTLCKTNNYEKAEKIKKGFNENNVSFLINANKLKLLTFELKERNKEFDFLDYDYASGDELKKDSYYAKVIGLVNQIIKEKS